MFRLFDFDVEGHFTMWVFKVLAAGVQGFRGVFESETLLRRPLLTSDEKLLVVTTLIVEGFRASCFKLEHRDFMG